jgi:hypothetical protein
MGWAVHIERVGMNIPSYRSIGTGTEGKGLLAHSYKYFLNQFFRNIMRLHELVS